MRGRRQGLALASVRALRDECARTQRRSVSVKDAQVVVIGAGPAGLTAAYALTKAAEPVTVLESDDVVGGISRTVERDGWRFDIGGHRFFTKVPAVEELWHEILPAEDFLLRPRMSRIYYENKLFDYPLKASNALKNLGVVEAVKCVLSYIWVRIHPPKDQSMLEGWVAARFGWRLYRTFFKTYNEKVWGVPASEIAADWAAQRIKNLSLFSAVLNSLMPKRNQTDITTLIEEFQYPKFGPGMMWERARDLVLEAGGTIVMGADATSIRRDETGAVAVVSTCQGREVSTPASAVISSMPLPELVLALDPPAPAEVQRAARRLSHRDFLTVALVVPESASFPDNWIYIHSPEVKVGRIQNFGSWSPYLVKDGRTCLGLEYFVFEGDDLWNSADDDLAVLAEKELIELGLVGNGQVEASYVVRMPKAYPVYDEGYSQAVDVIREWIDAAVPNIYPVGRNGMHKYNNQDHSMLTALLSVDNLLHGASHDVWAVNVEEDYHEEHSESRKSGEGATGRAAPVVPRRATSADEAAG
jgi:protoporphyrinogen oxidase